MQANPYYGSLLIPIDACMPISRENPGVKWFKIQLVLGAGYLSGWIGSWEPCC